MLSAEEIKNLNTIQRREMVDRLAVILLGTEQYKKALCEHLGLKHGTVNAWFLDGRDVPTPVLLYLQAEIERRHMKKGLAVFQRVLDGARD